MTALFRCLLPLYLFAGIVLAAWAQTDAPQLSDRACIDLIKGQLAARAAEDWEQLEQLAKRTVRSCQDVLPAEHISRAYANLAMATRKSGRPRDALGAAESGISTYYADTDCHLERIEALLALGRGVEAM